MGVIETWREGGHVREMEGGIINILNEGLAFYRDGGIGI